MAISGTGSGMVKRGGGGATLTILSAAASADQWKAAPPFRTASACLSLSPRPFFFAPSRSAPPLLILHRPHAPRAPTPPSSRAPTVAKPWRAASCRSPARGGAGGSTTAFRTSGFTPRRENSASSPAKSPSPRLAARAAGPSFCSRRLRSLSASPTASINWPTSPAESAAAGGRSRGAERAAVPRLRASILPAPPPAHRTMVR